MTVEVAFGRGCVVIWVTTHASLNQIYLFFKKGQMVGYILEGEGFQELCPVLSMSDSVQRISTYDQFWSTLKIK